MLATACGAPTGEPLALRPDYVDRAGRRVLLASDPLLRRDWYGRPDRRVWAERGTYTASSAKGRCGGGREVDLAIEGPLSLWGDCVWLLPRTISSDVAPELMFRGGPGITLEGWSGGALVDIDGEKHRLEHGAFRLPVPEEGLHLARFEGAPATVRVHVQAPSAPPHVAIDNAIVVLVDTLRADRLRPFNPASRVELPRVEALAGHADVYMRAFATASWTKPAVASVLTGLYPWEHRALTHDAHLRDVRTLPEVLGDFGIDTLAISGNGYASPAFGLDRGFERFMPVGSLGRGRLGDEVELLFEELDEREPGRFFAYLHATDPHSPYAPQPQHLRRFDAAPYEGPIDFSDDPMLLRRLNAGEIPLDARDRERLVALYDGEVAGLDQAFAALFEGLAHRQMLANTLVIIVADHGEELGDHGAWGHGGGRLNRELIQVPLMMWWPGVSAGRRIDAVASQIDIQATVLDAMNLHQDLGSRSARSLRALPPHRFVLFGQRDDRRGVTDGHMTLVRDRDGEMTLFDLDADPTQRDERASRSPRARRYLLQGLAREMASNPTHREPRPAANIDDTIAGQLRALGYVGDE